jgi:ABC-type xylose transport system permease subunit
VASHPPGPSGVLLLAEIDLSVGAVALIGGVIAFKYRCPLAPGAPGQR